MAQANYRMIKAERERKQEEGKERGREGGTPDTQRERTRLSKLLRKSRPSWPDED